MLAAWDYDQVCRELGIAFSSRYDSSHVRMVGLLFAPPEVGLAKDEIVPSLDYFHRRSGNHIDFFCAGYGRHDAIQGGRPITSDEQPWLFSLELYDLFRKDIEQRSRWRYSGEADLLLLNATRGTSENGVSLDFSTTIVCDLDRMVRDNAIRSVRRFFEDLIRFAETVQQPNPTWGFSDKMGQKTAVSALKRVVLSLLPKQLGADYVRAEHFAVRDVGLTA